MKLSELPKFFTPPLSESERTRIFETLGFRKMDWVIWEKCGEITLRKICISHDTILPSIEEPSLGETHRPSSVVSMHIEYPHVPYVYSKRRTLWEELFPPAINQYCPNNRRQPKDLTRVQVFPPVVEDAFTKLWESFSKVEAVALSQELCCLALEGVNGILPILIHCVRGRRVRIGTSTALEEFVGGIPSEAPTSAALGQYFGTGCLLIHLNLPQVLNETGVAPLQVAEHLDQAIQHALPTRYSPVGADPSDPDFSAEL